MEAKAVVWKTKVVPSEPELQFWLASAERDSDNRWLLFHVAVSSNELVRADCWALAQYCLNDIERKEIHLLYVVLNRNAAPRGIATIVGCYFTLQLVPMSLLELIVEHLLNIAWMILSGRKSISFMWSWTAAGRISSRRFGLPLG